MITQAIPVAASPQQTLWGRQCARSADVHSVESGALQASRSTAVSPTQISANHCLSRSPGCQNLSFERGADNFSPDSVQGTLGKLDNFSVESNRILASNLAESGSCCTQADHLGVRSMSCFSMNGHNSQAFNRHTPHSTALEEIYTVITQLKNLLKEDIATLRANFDSKLRAVEDNLIEGVKLQHNLMQTSFEWRVCAVQQHSREHANVIASIEDRLSAIEESRFCASQLQEAIAPPHQTQKEKVAKTMVANLTTIPEDQIALTEELVCDIPVAHAQEVMQQDGAEHKAKHTASKVLFEHRLSKAEGNIDLCTSLLNSIEARILNAVQDMLLSRAMGCKGTMSTAYSTCMNSSASSPQSSDASDAALSPLQDTPTKADHPAPVADEISSCDDDAPPCWSLKMRQRWSLAMGS